MYLFDFKQFFISFIAGVLCLMGSAALAQQGPFPRNTVLAAPPSPTKVPDFEFANLNGGTLKSSEMKGKVIIIRFWATW